MIVKIDPIAVKNKEEVIKAFTILEKIGIDVFDDKQKKNYLEDEKRKVENNYMMQESDGGFRIQSHYIGTGISIESLEKQVNEILQESPDIAVKVREINELIEKSQREIEKLESEVKHKKSELTKNKEILHIKQIKKS